MKASGPQTIYLKDYTVSPFLMDRVDLHFQLFDDYTIVKSKLRVSRNPASADRGAPLVLNGEELELVNLRLNGADLSREEYVVTADSLTIKKVPGDSFTLECETKIKPRENLTLSGLYQSGQMFCTQCEAQGFRRITYYLDRPDVMSVFTTTVEADKTKYPILLSNGNPIERKDLPGGRHLVTWNDPFKKPAYLFALVAGDLDCNRDNFVTKSGRKVALEIYVDKGNADRTHHAMSSLKESMRWDENTFGLEYDLDIFMIVAVNDFNFGAMENKGLNIFNANYVLADARSATDTDYENIEAIVAHEYFHNWTGNRVTCRDWFQLSLKEGLTVYRDQEFSADVTSRPVKRIDDVNSLRNRQFPEDAGPMAHPIRPATYMEIDNFYTATVYDKGAEVIRMIATILGREKFRKGIDKYFDLYDGMAVTTEDFVRAMEVASGVDLTQFRETWYSQAGTPEITVKTHYDHGAKKYFIELSQSCPSTPGQDTKRPFVVPFTAALYSAEGKELAEKTLLLTEKTQTFEFANIGETPVPSLLRNFSAPVKVKYPYSRNELSFLFARDRDAFARWDAGQTLALEVLQDLVNSDLSGVPLAVNRDYLASVREVLMDPGIDHAYKAQLIEIPEEGYIGQQQKVIHIDSIHRAREFLQKTISEACERELLAVYEDVKPAVNRGYVYTPKDVGRRALLRQVLSYLVAGGKEKYRLLAAELAKTADNMTDELSALAVLNDHDSVERTTAFQRFYDKWKHDTLVMNKWLGLQSGSGVPGTLHRIKGLMKDEVFNINNPNKIYALFLNFGRANLSQFHAVDGKAYEFFADLVLDIDTRNPSVAARVASLFNDWRRYDEKRQALAKKELERILAKEKLSPNVYEIVAKALK